MTQIDEIKRYIRSTGVAEVSRATQISLRTLHYLIKGEFKPSYVTLQKLLKAMGNGSKE
jgi:DNA-binding phage protein